MTVDEAWAGSSPLTRGKHGVEGGVSGREGLIPAHAGKTFGAGDLAGDKRAHPRSRGENLHLVTVDEAWAGSSPLTRGKHGVEGGVSGREGLIPAHAGKTFGAGDLAGDKRAHPRSRGENLSVM